MKYEGETTLFQTCGSCNAPIVVPSEIVETSRDMRIENVVNMPPPEEIPTEEVMQIKSLLAEGRKIEAIKVYRETFGSSLADAKDAVENMESQTKFAIKDFPDNTPRDVTASVGSDSQLGLIKNELLRGNKINAIKMFRETYHCGLKEAKDAVDAMELGENINVSEYL
jgi:ribosomal protein L7/L12